MEDQEARDSVAFGRNWSQTGSPKCTALSASYTNGDIGANDYKKCYILAQDSLTHEKYHLEAGPQACGAIAEAWNLCMRRAYTRQRVLCLFREEPVHARILIRVRPSVVPN